MKQQFNPRIPKRTADKARRAKEKLNVTLDVFTETAIEFFLARTNVGQRQQAIIDIVQGKKL